MKDAVDRPSKKSGFISLFMCGDVMTGRGIDQILPHPSEPRLYESYVATALDYVDLAERASGPIPRPAGFSYIWGDMLEEFDRLAPDVRIINLETSVTTSEDYWEGKDINYRMHPANVPCITAAMIDCCVLANNHVLDWGCSGLAETLETLKKAGLKTAGAGRNIQEAETPAAIEIAGKGRVIVFSFGSDTSGIPGDWGATEDRPGVNLLKDLDDKTVRRIARGVRAVKQERDIVVVSIHWGGNWGYGIPRDQSKFAHQLIDDAGVDVVHGHSSHHPKGIEIYRSKPVIYGCGDFLNDYEGIGGHEEYRGNLVLLYFVTMDPSSGNLIHFEMTPARIRRFRLNQASKQEAEWLGETLNREGRKFGFRVELKEDHARPGRTRLTV